MSATVVSFYEKKMQKENQNKEKMFETIYDFYIPYSEVPFWTEVCKYAQNIKGELFSVVERNREVKEFLHNFALDIEMYQEFGYTLEKFRFLFSYFELFVLYQVLKMMQNEGMVGQKEEIEHNLNFLSRTIDKNKTLSELLKQTMLLE